MFQLSEAIAGWRMTLGGEQVCSAPDLDELESHLLEEIENLRSVNLSEEEAFWIATHRLGDTRAINDEFAKVNDDVLWRYRILWMSAGLLAFLLLDFVAKCAADVATWLGSASGHTSSSLAICAVLAKIAVYVPALFFLYHLCKPSQSGESNPVKQWFAIRNNLFLGVVACVVGIFSVLRIIALYYTVARLGSDEWFHMISLQGRWNSVFAVALPILLAILIMRLRFGIRRRVESQKA